MTTSDTSLNQRTEAESQRRFNFNFRSVAVLFGLAALWMSVLTGPKMLDAALIATAVVLAVRWAIRRPCWAFWRREIRIKSA